MAEFHDRSKFHGWRLADKSLHIGYLPKRKLPSLYFTDDNVSTAIASFSNEDEALAAQKFIDGLLSFVADRAMRGTHIDRAVSGTD